MIKNILFISALILMSFASTETQKPNMAEVEKVNGLYVFIKSEPVSKFGKLGAVKSGFFISDLKASNVIEVMTKKALKEYPAANAVIFTDKDLLECNVIKIAE